MSFVGISSFSMSERRPIQGLHVLINFNVPQATLEGIIRAQPSVIQLRDKNISDPDMIRWGREIKRQLQFNNSKSLIIVNDRLPVAQSLQANGLHVGQKDMEATVARVAFPQPRLLGVSVATLQEAEIALEAKPDYLGVGPIFATVSKKDAHEPIGLKNLSKIKALAGEKPVVAIGGITLENVKDIMDAGADGVAVIGAVLRAPNPEEVIYEFERIIFSRVMQYA